MANRTTRQTLGYAAAVAGCFAAGMLTVWTPVGIWIDNYRYGQMLAGQAVENSQSQSVVVKIDEPTLGARGGMRNIRPIIAEALDKIAVAKPKVVAVDIILADPQDNAEADNARLEAAFRATPNLILDCDLIVAGNVRKWEDPLPRFAGTAAELGHAHREDAGADGVTRKVPLEEIADGKRRWALALEAFRLARGENIIDSPDDVEVGNVTIPAARAEGGRPMWIRYLPAGAIPEVSVLEIDQHRDMIQGKAVFLGVTALGARDRVVNPFGVEVPGVEVHAQAYETLVRGQFLTKARNFTEFGLCAMFALAAGLIFALRSGWQAYALGAVLLVVAHWTPIEFFRHGVVISYFAPVGVAWLSTVGAASFQHFFVRRELRQSESEKTRYQQAIHWAAHEMRSPLTAIQGSSEIMSRYSLPEEKRHQLSEMINSESKRLARMIQTFLDVERLADGHMDLKRESFPLAAVVDVCMKRVAPLAETKRIALSLDSAVDGAITGDRELLEYAFYNLLTNAVKYSPAETEVHVTAELRGSEIRLAVRDQGIGMDAKELKSIFQKFYRTKRAEASGEVGTGIGLSIVEQIVSHHGGRIEVTSEPGQGSCFTMILAVSHSVPSAATDHAETLDRRG